mmetsp:Transcript_124807/g.364525  ORF Transcript_124807/g.364525 Transcript_124807/m.364525 type:complete len:224 (+) Transcript_124807:92-763(+)
MGLPWPGAICRITLTSLLVATLATGVSSEKDNIVKLTKYNFENNVRRGAWFVKFYAPWCTHCQRLAPIWEKLADEAVARDWPVRIAEVDCTVSKDVCEKAQVKAYPMLALIADGVLKGKYQGEASLSHFEGWLSSQQALKTGASGGGSLDMTESARPQATASHITAASAVISNFVARFPTKSKILNIYIYGGIGLAMLVAFLCALFRLVDAEDTIDAEHEKEG